MAVEVRTITSFAHNLMLLVAHLLPSKMLYDCAASEVTARLILRVGTQAAATSAVVGPSVKLCVP